MNQYLDSRTKRGLYIRVSTEAQAEEGYSVAAQTERLEAFCKAKGWNDYETYVDGGFSGSNLNRPEVQRLIADVEANKIKSVIVYKLDRLSRSQKDTLFLIEDIFLPKEVDFISLNESIDTSTPYGRAMIGILSAFAQLERENIYMRTRMGMLERVKQGLWMGGGCIPFGYDYDRVQGILVPNEDAKLVRRMYDLYIKGYSAQKIANMLDLKYDRLVIQVLTRRSNLGIIYYKGEEYEGKHEPIVSEEVFELAQRKMMERSTQARATSNSAHLLTGLVYCGECGARMRYVKWGKSGYKLRCYSLDTSKPYMQRVENCPSETVWADQIEAAVLNDLFRISANMDNASSDDMLDAIDPLLELSARITQLEKRLNRLYTLYADGDDDTLLHTINENKKALASAKAVYESELNSNSQSKQLNSIMAQVSTIADTWEYLSDMDKQTLIRDCVNKIVITGNRVEIFYSFMLRQGEVKCAVA